MNGGILGMEGILQAKSKINSFSKWKDCILKSDAVSQLPRCYQFFDGIIENDTPKMVLRIIKFPWWTKKLE